MLSTQLKSKATKFEIVFGNGVGRLKDSILIFLEEVHPPRDEKSWSRHT